MIPARDSDLFFIAVFLLECLGFEGSEFIP